MKKIPTFVQGQRVEVLCDVHWTDDNDVERITAGPSTGVVTAVDKRQTATVYEITLDNDSGYFMHEFFADGPVVRAI